MQPRGDLAKDVPPTLVSGAPRSGTTWLARLLANSSGTALLGREPMNPRRRGYALAGTLDGWTRLTTPNRRQVAALRRVYRGRNPWTFGRYGRRQWAAPKPTTRVIVKDPFAMLSLPAITRITGASVVLIYRHPAAVLASYRRMGWSPDIDELRPIVAESLGNRVRREGNEAETFGTFWAGLYDVALSDLDGIEAAIVSHEELASGGVRAANRLFAALGLSPTGELEREFAHDRRDVRVDDQALHHFDRDPAQVAEEWRHHVNANDLAAVEATTRDTHQRLAAGRLVLAHA